MISLPNRPVQLSGNRFMKISVILALLFAIVVIVFAQFATPTLYGFDGYYHIRMADLIRDSGPIRDFHWARFSTFSTHFTDKSFLYHLMLIPFTFIPNIFLGAKISCCLFAILFLFIFFMILRKYSHFPLIPIFIIAPFLSYDFVAALSKARPMNLAIILSLLAIYFLIEKRLWAVSLVTVVYCLSHISGPYLLFYALLIETVRYFSKKEFYFKSIVVVFLSILGSFLIHPNFPNNIMTFYLNGILVPVYAFTGKLNMGTELLPLSTREFLFSFPFVVLGLLFLLFLVFFGRPRAKFPSQVLFTFSAVFIVPSFLSFRFLIHAYPIFLLFLASYTSDYLQDKSSFRLYQKNRVLAKISFIVLCILFFQFGLINYRNMRWLAGTYKERLGAYEQAGKWMSKNIPPGELIFHTKWYDAAVFFGLNPKNDYTHILHPVYMYWINPKAYDIYNDLVAGRTKEPYSILSNAFKVKYGFAKKGYGLTKQIREDARFKILYENKVGLIFQLD